MAYSQGGVIAATDYNGFVGPTTGNNSNTINAIWGPGNGVYGLGQTAISQVSGGTDNVTATQWSNLIGKLNIIKTHQTGSATGISSSITQGQVITYLATLSSAISTVYSAQGTATFAAQGTTTLGSNNASQQTAPNQTAASTFNITRTATFASADQARYFFNNGGQLNFVISSVSNNNGTTRSGDLVTLAATNLASYSAFRATSGGGKTGSGGTVNTNATTIGYYNLTTSDQTLVQITGTNAAYSGDYVQLKVKSNGTIGSNGDKGTVITFTLTLYSAAQSAYSAPGGAGPGGSAPTVNTTTEDAIDITVNHKIDIIYPETASGISNSWGTVTIA
jgi:hypothetical protein